MSTDFQQKFLFQLNQMNKELGRQVSIKRLSVHNRKSFPKFRSWKIFWIKNVIVTVSVVHVNYKSVDFVQVNYPISVVKSTSMPIEMLVWFIQSMTSNMTIILDYSMLDNRWIIVVRICSSIIQASKPVANASVLKVANKSVVIEVMNYTRKWNPSKIVSVFSRGISSIFNVNRAKRKSHEWFVHKDSLHLEIIDALFEFFCVCVCVFLEEKKKIKRII